jgi:hypothetical protein
VKPLGQHLLVDLFDCDANAISTLQVRLERGVLGPNVEEMRDRLLS